MKHTFFLVPISSKVGLTAISLGLVQALDKRGLRVGFCKPVGQFTAGDDGPERSTHFIRATTGLKPSTPIRLDEAEKMVAAGRNDDLMGVIMRAFHESSRDADIMIVEGLAPVADDSYTGKLNDELIRTLSAEVILVGNAAHGVTTPLRDAMDLAARRFASGGQNRIAGCIINRVHVGEADPADALRAARSTYESLSGTMPPLVGLVPENETLTYCRTVDIARHLNAEILSAGEMTERRVKAIHLLARTVPNMMHVFRAGNILVSPSDRDDVLLATCMAAVDKVPIAGLVLTGDTVLDERIYHLCDPGIRSGLPVLRVYTNSYETASQLYNMSDEVPVDDLERIRETMEFVSGFIDGAWIEERCKQGLETHLSPAAFCFQLTERALLANKRIILPEGSEPRTIRAAVACAERKIARCVLLGDPDEIRHVAAAQEVRLPAGVEIIHADAVRGNYVDALIEMRKHKNLTRQAAADQLEDDVVLGTMMLALGEVDGLVSGAVHSSANTVRPALQLIKTKPGVKSVSSVFFMCLPDQVLVYGDCAVIQNPDAPTMAEIAVQSAESAARFGIHPHVAMLSYSTGTSGSGAEVEKVREATRLAKEMRPDLLIDGPLQYDAAATLDVARTKAPSSPVAGHATVFIFPDLNTGNTTYKAVQRSANIIAIGPMLQGLRRPVNDLSRGALVEDIIYTIALTAVQATE